jgi:hypothetical protein
MIYYIFYVLQEDRLQLMANGLLSVFIYFQNEAHQENMENSYQA